MTAARNLVRQVCSFEARVYPTRACWTRHVAAQQRKSQSRQATATPACLRQPPLVAGLAVGGEAWQLRHCLQLSSSLIVPAQLCGGGGTHIRTQLDTISAWLQMR